MLKWGLKWMSLDAKNGTEMGVLGAKVGVEMGGFGC